MTKKRTVPEQKLFAKHSGREQRLCELVAKRRMNTVATLSTGSKRVCRICGRASAKAQNMCEPVEI